MLRMMQRHELRDVFFFFSLLVVVCGRPATLTRIAPGPLAARVAPDLVCSVDLQAYVLYNLNFRARRPLPPPHAVPRQRPEPVAVACLPSPLQNIQLCVR